MAGKLYIIGVGPGDKELLTVKAAKVLGTVEHVFVPVSAEGRESLAYDIAQLHIQSNAAVTELLFPMQMNKNLLKTNYIGSYNKIESVLRGGKDAALISIGDPCTYSTSWPILTMFKSHSPDINVEVVPGITSYADAAAHAAKALVAGNEILSVVSSYDSVDRIESAVDFADTVVFLKTYKKREIILDLLARKGLTGQCIYIQRCGLEGEKIIFDMAKLPAETDYFSMIILIKRKEKSQVCEL